MKVFLAEGSGFCFGVKRAMDMAYKYALENEGKDICSLHEIIHNPQEVKRLEKTGARHVGSIDGIKKGARVIISTHGIPAGEEARLRKKASDVLDTTCPYVKKIHNIVRKLTEEKYQVVIVGDREHLEVRGLLGYGGPKAVVVGSAGDILKTVLEEKVGVVSQTTQDAGTYEKMIAAVTKRAFRNSYAEVRVFNTICDATKNRQEATMALAGKADVMIIVGGKNSANTKRLYELSRKKLSDVHHVEGAGDIKKIWFKGKKAAGVSAGASTPARVIEAVVEKIKMIGEK